MKILIIDNFDSFTYNLYQLVGEILEDSGQSFVLEVKRNNEISIKEIKQEKYDRVIISPGPGNPANSKYFGVCKNVILEIAKTVPVLGVCLGMQGIAHYMGGKVLKAQKPMHGKTSKLRHNSQGVFKNIPQNIQVMRYHSLVVDRKRLPKVLEITAESVGEGKKEIMGLRHKNFLLEGVQFHPESFATEFGKQILQNFLAPRLINFQKPLAYVDAYNFQEAILKNEISTEKLVECFQMLEKRALGQEEFLGFYKASKNLMTSLPAKHKDLLDTCGTGGDGMQTFNISTLSAVVCASLGVRVAKHGNRAASGKCGSADVLESLGVNINLNPNQARVCLEKCGITFMFAPVYHSAFKFAREARIKFGRKTYFNLLGPLLNPADAGFRLIGVADEKNIPIILHILKQARISKAVVVHSFDNLDEVSPCSKTRVYELNKQGSVKKYIINPNRFGLKNLHIADLQVSNQKEYQEIFLNVLSGKGKLAQMSAVILNTAVGLLTAGVVENLQEGIRQASASLYSGKALAKFEEFKQVSHRVVAS